MTYITKPDAHLVVAGWGLAVFVIIAVTAWCSPIVQIDILDLNLLIGITP